MLQKIKNKINSNVGTKNQETREIWLEETLLKIPQGNSILDAGAGELQYKKFCSHLDYTSQDFGKYDGKGNNEGLQTDSFDNSKLNIISDITKIPAKDNSFDALMCTEVLEHLPKPIKAIKEFSRIIKSGGKLIITAPFCSLTHFAPYYFSNGYSKYWYEKILKENDFIISEIDYNGNYFEYLAQEIRQIPKMENNILIKKYLLISLIKLVLK
ncbi:MAG: class I SAM-dependent methyltransferase [Candidatus Pacebacteria bacterium]|nr:class I SAM-dependent methyltransferase [Candidatus Paceibacterota bacterium]